MRRKQISQISTSSWCPGILRLLVSEFLTWFVDKVGAAKPFIPVIQRMVSETGNHKLINLDLNLGAGIETVIPFLDPDIKVVRQAFTQKQLSEDGIYIMVNSFHHLNEKEALTLLNTIIRAQKPLVVVEGNNDSLWQVVGMTIFVPLSVLLSGPFVKPFRMSRLVFTYLIPVLPFILLIDGCIALLKLYNPDDLKILVSRVNVNNYKWSYGKNDNGRGGKIIFLTGRPTY